MISWPGGAIVLTRTPPSRAPSRRTTPARSWNALRTAASSGMFSRTPPTSLLCVTSRDFIFTATGYSIPEAAARILSQIQASLCVRGRTLADADLQIASTAILHGLEVVTDNLRHFARIPGIHVHRALADARGSLLSSGELIRIRVHLPTTGGAAAHVPAWRRPLTARDGKLLQ